jgi:hypothetical protein
MFKKYLLFVVIFLIVLTNVRAQKIESRKECQQPTYPKGAYDQTVEQYSNTTQKDSVTSFSVVSELSVILNFKKSKKVTLLVRQCSPNCTYPNPFKYVYEKKGTWIIQTDTVTIIWKYRKDALSAKWFLLKNTESYKLKYERYYKTNYPIIGCRSALIPEDKNPFIGYGN